MIELKKNPNKETEYAIFFDGEIFTKWAIDISKMTDVYHLKNSVKKAYLIEYGLDKKPWKLKRKIEDNIYYTVKKIWDETHPDEMKSKGLNTEINLADYAVE
jgi:hypothetical protein